MNVIWMIKLIISGGRPTAATKTGITSSAFITGPVFYYLILVSALTYLGVCRALFSLFTKYSHKSTYTVVFIWYFAFAPKDCLAFAPGPYLMTITTAETRSIEANKILLLISSLAKAQPRYKATTGLT